MNNFEFGYKVSIRGVLYTVNDDMEVNRRLFEKCIKEMNEAEASAATDLEKISRIKEASRKLLDSLLGAGAFDRIYAGKAFTIPSFVSLLKFLRNEMDIWRTEAYGR